MRASRAACPAVWAHRNRFSAAFYNKRRRVVYSFHICRTAFRAWDAAFDFVCHGCLDIILFITARAAQVIKRHFNSPPHELVFSFYQIAAKTATLFAEKSYAATPACYTSYPGEEDVYFASAKRSKDAERANYRRMR